jgi:hypothetical protein
MHDRVLRSPHWDKLRGEVIKERGSKCEVSGATTDLEAHHIIPFHFCVILGRPELELEKKNLIILSRGPVDIHLLLGHFDNFGSFNKDITDIEKWKEFIKNKKDLAHDPEYLQLKAKRPKLWDDMTTRDKTNLRKLMDKLYPKG